MPIPENCRTATPECELLRPNDETPGAVRESGEASSDARRTEAPAPGRHGLIDRVRAEIANGTYETATKIDALLPRLAKDLQAATRPTIFRAVPAGRGSAASEASSQPATGKSHGQTSSSIILTTS